jgi:iron complex transport system permease protein
VKGARPATRARALRVFAVVLLVLCACLAASLSLGGERVDVLGVLSGRAPETETFILRELRLPRTIAAALVGGALATAGVVFQALLRNPLAEPYLLGLSGGGSFGAVVSIVAFGAASFASAGSRVVAAFAGCLAAIGLVYAVASRGGGLRPATLLLAGVVVNAFFLAALAAAQYVASPTEAQAILRWVMGGLSVPRPGELALLGVAVPFACLVVYLRAPQLNLLVFDEETARNLGVDVANLRRLLFVTTSLLTAACVAVSGPIGFVGLFVPHAVRALAGGDHRILLPAAWGAGAAFLALADALARTVFAPQELPVGIVTAVVGAPALVVLLASRAPLRESAA